MVKAYAIAKPVRRERIGIKDPGSALTHFIGFVAAFLATPFIIIHGAKAGADSLLLTGIGIFMLSMMTLYAASTTYHSFDISDRANKLLKKIDHMSIFLLIAGSYTPICLSVLRDGPGYKLLASIWLMAVVGMIFKLFWVTCPKWLSSVIYIGMGWMCIGVMPQLLSSLPMAGFLWMLAGGIMYTVGGVIYALKFDVFRGRFRYFATHELFHVFVLAGTLCQFICIYGYIM